MRRSSAILGLVNEIIIRRVAPADSALLRRVRLLALATDPASFGSTYEREAAFSDDVWAERAQHNSRGDDASTLIAICGDAPVGKITGARDEARPDVFHVFGTWVAPAARRDNVGRTLLHEIEAWAISRGGTSMQLSVTDTAAAAQQLYARAGYAADGGSVESVHTPGLRETSLTKYIGAPASRPAER